MSNSIKEILLIQGFNSNLDLGIKWVTPTHPIRNGYESITVATPKEDGLKILGSMELSVINLEKIKNQTYTILTKNEEDQWVSSELDYVRVPREVEENFNELIHVGGNANESDEIEF